MDNQSVPRVTMALPLYKSRRFLDIITENLDTLDYPNLEILISDRHCADEAIDILQARYGHDPRFQFLRARDEINYVEHFNSLLCAATGAYFFWLMHDDSYPPQYIAALANALNEHPDAILAYGGIELLRPDGSREIIKSQVSNRTKWNTREIFQRFLDGHLLLAVRGLYRLAPLRQRGLLIQPTRDLFAADFLWTFATAFVGRWILAPELCVQKRIYPTSALGHWHSHTAPHTLAEAKALRIYLIDRAPNTREKIRGASVILVWTLLRLGGDALYWTRLHRRLHNPIQQFLVPLFRS